MTVGHTLLSRSEKLLLREVFTSMQDSGSLPGYICTYVIKALIHIRLLDRKLTMENEFLDKVENNAVNNLQELKEIWVQWDDEVK
ncbi:hypothetical protein Gotur_028091 [Gossypium turneri]